MFVYVVSEADATLVKIGRATNVASRLSGLRTGSPVDLVLRAQWEGDAADEKRLHRAFAEKRVRGEWFEFDDGDPVAAVSAMLGREPVPPPQSPVAPPKVPGKRVRGGRQASKLPRVENLAGFVDLHRTLDGQVVGEVKCMRTCVGSEWAWAPGHTHTIVMTEEQYERFSLLELLP